MLHFNQIFFWKKKITSCHQTSPPYPSLPLSLPPASTALILSLAAIPPPSSLPRHPKRRSKMLSSSLRLLSWQPADVIRVTLGAQMSERPSDLVIFHGADSRERERRKRRKRRSASVCPCVSFPSFVWRRSRSADAATTECKAINIYIRVERAEAQLRNINTSQRSNLSHSLYFFN